jgi:DNA polymerase-3 subunit alpha
MLGLYVSDHPLMGFEAALRRSTECTIAELHEAADGEVRLVGGVVTNLIRKYTRKGDLMATFVLEDLQASITAWVFPRTMQELGWVLADDAVVIVKGRLDQRDDETKLVVLDIRREELKNADTVALEVQLPLATLNDTVVEELKSVLVTHPGGRPVILHIGAKRLRLATQFCVDTTNGLHADLRRLLGVDCIVVA